MAALRDMINQKANDIRLTGVHDAPDYIELPLESVRRKADLIKVSWSGFLESKELKKSSFIVDEGEGVVKISWLVASH